MCHDLAQQFAIVRQTIEEVEESLRFRLSKLMFGIDTNAAQQLELTEFAQPAILTHSIAGILVDYSHPESIELAMVLDHS
jgi:malonyl CoA-acyl carrier protein transacylase